MSTLIVEVKQIDSIEKHPNADALELCMVGGFQIVEKIGKFKVGDKAVYFPADSVLPVELSDEIGCTQYLSNGRLRHTKLRGEPSFGLLHKLPEGVDWEIGTDVAEYYGVTKYIPPARLTSEDFEKEHPLFVQYTDIENLRHFPDAFVLGEEVIATEKIHGYNSRTGMIEGEIMVGSMNYRRKYDEHNPGGYSYAASLEPVRNLLQGLYHDEGYHSIIIFGETFGGGIQKGMTYNQKSHTFRAFDLMLNGKYVNYDQFVAICEAYRVPTVPLIYRGPYIFEEIVKAADGKSTVGGDHIREGVVVKPAVGRQHPKLGRLILKYVSDKYLLKDYEDFNDV